MQKPKRNLASLVKPIPAGHAPALFILLPELEILDAFCSANEADLDPSYIGDGSRGCVSVAITLPDSVKLPGDFLLAILNELGKTLGKDSPLALYMSRNISVVRSGGKKILVFPRLAAQV